MNVLSIISISLGIFLSVSSVITLIVTNVKTKKVNYSAVKDGVRALIRSEILNYYYNNVDKKQLRQYERENVDKLYEAYKALEGNSFIDDVYELMRDWEVIT